MKQYLTRADGSIPDNVDISALEAAGIRLVRPTEPPRQSGMLSVEIEPEMRNGVWYQAWSLEPAPVFQTVLVPTKEELLAQLVALQAQIEALETT